MFARYAALSMLDLTSHSLIGIGKLEPLQVGGKLEWQANRACHHLPDRLLSSKLARHLASSSLLRVMASSQLVDSSQYHLSS